MFFLPAQLQFQDKNDINAEIRKRTGDNVTLNCDIVGIPKPTITWYKNGIKITSNGRYSQSINAKDTRLLLSKLKLTDTGWYQCFGSNEFESIERSIFLFIQPANCMYHGLISINNNTVFESLYIVKYIEITRSFSYHYYT